MSARLPDRETLLEVGLAAAAGLLLAGLGVLLAGRLKGAAKRRQRRSEGPPAPGSVPDERHQHTAAVSAR